MVICIIMVNTFVISDDPTTCAQNLDRKRLGKQRVEAYQVLNIITGKTDTKGFTNHPLCKMWYGFDKGLMYYINCMIDEWVKRGYKNTMKKYDDVCSDDLPWWYTNKQIQYANMASLVRKEPEYYKLKFIYPDKYESYGYIWLSNVNEDIIKKMKKGNEIDLSILCSPIGTGAPSQYRYTIDECKQWIKNKTKNPKTGRTIKENGPMYKDYKKASEFYKLLEQKSKDKKQVESF